MPQEGEVPSERLPLELHEDVDVALRCDLVASGGVRVTTHDPAGGEDIVVADLGPGDVVGEISIVLRRPATATVSTAFPTIALELSRERFQEAIRRHPAVLTELYALATARQDELHSVVAQEALDVEDVVLL